MIESREEDNACKLICIVYREHLCSLSHLLLVKPKLLYNFVHEVENSRYIYRYIAVYLLAMFSLSFSTTKIDDIVMWYLNSTWSFSFCVKKPIYHPF